MDGAVLFNAALFFNDTKGMLISNLEDAGSVNYNVDAEIKGFEGNMIAFLSETSSIDISWLLVESELGDQTMPDPLNPAGIVELLDVDPTAWTPGVGCATATGLCGPTAFGAGVDGLPFDAQGQFNTVTVLMQQEMLCQSLNLLVQYVQLHLTSWRRVLCCTCSGFTWRKLITTIT